MIAPAQPPVFVQSLAAVSALAVAMGAPTTVGNVLLAHVRFSPTGVPSLADNYGNRYRRLGTLNEGGSTAVGFWIAPLAHAGVNHTVTIAAMGGVQTFEAGVMELAIHVPHPGEESPLAGIALAQLAQLYEQTALLKRLVTAERA